MAGRQNADILLLLLFLFGSVATSQPFEEKYALLPALKYSIAFASNGGTNSDGACDRSDGMPTSSKLLRTPNEIRQRAAAAFIGAVAGDAAAQTSHWNYDRSALRASLTKDGRCDAPEFYAKNSFYRVEPGGQSCYGDQMLEVARHIASHDRGDGDDPIGRNPLTSPSSRSELVSRLERAFGPSSPYGPHPSPKLERESMPIDGPWRHASIKAFLDNLSDDRRDYPGCGSDDEQVDAIARAVPVVCAYAGRRDLLELVEAAIRVTQNSDKAVRYGKLAARILEACVLGTAGSVREAIEVAAVGNDEQSVGVRDQNGKDKGEEEACEMVRLVLEILDRPPASLQDLEEAAEVLAAKPEMRALLTSPVSLVA